MKHKVKIRRIQRKRKKDIRLANERRALRKQKMMRRWQSALA